MKKERGLTFCQELVPKVLAGSKFVTRRLGGLKEINENPDAVVRAELIGENVWYFFDPSGNPQFAAKCRQGVVGDRFYMQEAWGLLYPDYNPMNHRAAVIGAWRAAVDATSELAHPTLPLIPVYKVDHLTGNDGPEKVRWRSGRFQPKWACRPQRWELISIRPERLLEITEEDAAKEGFEHWYLPGPSPGDICIIPESWGKGWATKGALGAFVECWNKLNAKRGYPSINNPWVWREEWNPVPECVSA